MTFDTHSLFGYSLIDSVVSQVANILVFNVQAGHGTRFAISQQITIWPIGANPTLDNAMICRITGIVGDQITASYTVGNREGSNIRTVQAGDQVYNSITPKILTDIETQISNPTKAFVTVGYSNADYIVDGIADDVQIQAAIDAVTALGGGIVYLKEGTYNLTNNNPNPAFQQVYTGSLYACILLKDKVTLKGAGIGKTILNLASFVGGLPLGQGCNVIVNSAVGQSQQGVMDMSITMPAFSVSAGAYGRCLNFAGVNHLTLQNLYLYRGSWAVFGNTYSWDNVNKILTTDTRDILVEKVIADTFKDSSMLFNLIRAKVLHCTYLTSYDDALLVAQSGRDILIDGTGFDGDSTHVGSATAHIYVFNDNSLTTDKNALSDIRIVNNSIRNLNTLIGESSGIVIRKAVKVKINDNLIEGNLGHGIYNVSEGNLQDIIIKGNTIRKNGGYGIKLPITVGGGGFINGIIQANSIYNNTTYGIYVETAAAAGTCDGLTISDNEIYDDQGAGATQANGLSLHIGVVSFTNLVASMNNIHDTATPYDIAVYGGATLTGGILYMDAGALKYRGGGGTITIVAAA